MKAKFTAAALAFALPAIAIAGATASSFKKETRLGTNYWNAQAAIDGKMDTAWLVPGESPNMGEWIMLDLPKSKIDKIAIVGGFAKSDETWSDHPRVKKLKLDVLCCADSERYETTGTAEITLEDKPGWQTIDITDLAVGSELFGGRVRLSVVEVYPGADFPNVGISELNIYLTEFDAKAELGEASGDLPDHMFPDIMDANPKTFWAAPAEGARFTVSASGYGVSSVQIEAGPKDFARPKKVKVIANGREAISELPDKPGMQAALVPSVTGYTGSAWGDIAVEILEVYPGAKSQEVAIAEIKVKATNFEGL